MDIIADLLPHMDLLKADNTAKDGRHPQSKKARKAYGTVNIHQGEPVQVRPRTSEWKDVDRRSGKDRRKQLEKRGRWLESRDRSNRRFVEESLYLTV